jgi:hypothetical protein
LYALLELGHRVAPNFERFALKWSGVACFLTLECSLQCNECRHFERDGSMDPKITLLFMLIGSVIGLSRLNDTSLDRVRRQLAGRHWREFMPRRRKV